MPVRKAIFVVAGFGTRFLPATRALLKTMIPLVDKPLFQIVIEEAVASGIEEIIVVTNRGEHVTADHFDRNFSLEERLERQGKTDEAEAMRRLSDLVKLSFVHQQRPDGDGHALLCAVPFIEPNETVAVLFGDDIFDSPAPVTTQIIAAYDERQAPVVALFDVGRENAPKFGVAGGEMVAPKLMRLNRYVEKPSLAEAPSSFAGVGRHIVTPNLLEVLKNLPPGKGGELRLADAFGAFVERGGAAYGRVVDGTRYDCGNKLEFMKAAVTFARRHPEINAGGEFDAFLKNLVASQEK
jgi:UTP--glucose-1-phosphate uridylyltransferase